MRVWNIPEQKVQDWADVHEMVTAVAWSHNGEQAVVGSMKGKCRFYACTPRTHALEYTGQIGGFALLDSNICGSASGWPQIQRHATNARMLCKMQAKTACTSTSDSHWCLSRP